MVNSRKDYSVLDWITFILSINHFVSARDGRLPPNVQPYHYNLQIHPLIYDPKKTPHFKGYVDIYIHCLVETDHIIMHSRGLRFSLSNITVTTLGHKRTVTIEEKSGSNREIHNYDTDPKVLSMDCNDTFDMVSLKLDRILIQSKSYILHISYTGTMGTASTGIGLYWFSYKKQTMAATHFSPVGARRVFPCFDEPVLKATFNLSISRLAQMKTLANTELLYSEKLKEADVIVDYYETTPLMSTYLVAFIVHDFNYEQRICHNSLKVTVWARDHGLSQCLYALSKVCQLFNYFEKYTGIEYPLTKMDIISIPGIPTSAMENWGLIIYQEKSLWFSPNIHPSSLQVNVIMTLAHEIAHMWFGNFVTPAWWSELWLKEGFATFFKYRAVQYLYPSWAIENLEVTLSLHTVLGADGATNAHPIIMDIISPDKLKRLFNQQTYGKASCILRMLSKIIGKVNFNSCVKEFIWLKAFGSATTEDFFEVCGSITGMNVTNLLLNWFTYGGFPVLSITLKDDYITFTQQPFSSHLRPYYQPSEEFLWNIPISVPLSNGSFQLKILNESRGSINNRYQISSINDQILVNRKQTGYYRVNYGSELIQVLSKNLEEDHESFTMIDRSQIIDDVYRLARIGKGREVNALELTEYMHKETGYLPWHTLVRNLDFTLSLISQTDIWPRFREYFTSKLQKVYKSIPWSNSRTENVETGLLMEEMLLFACQMEHEPCLQRAQSFFKQCLHNDLCHELNPNIRKAVLCSGVHKGDLSDWERVLSLYHNYPELFDQDVLISLACSRNSTILNEYLNVIMDGGMRTTLDATVAINSLIYNTVGQDIVWAHLRRFWDVYPLGFMKGSVLLTLASTFCTEERQEELSSFIEDKIDMSLVELYLMASELGKENMAWLEHNYKSIKHWLQEELSTPRMTYSNDCQHLEINMLLVLINAFSLTIIIMYH